MFDIGFSELALVFIVGLVVLGPQRLPIAIRTVMSWVKTIRGLATNVQNEISQELKLQELQESIKKAEQLNLNRLSPELSKTVEDLKQSAQKMQASLQANQTEIEGLTSEQVAEIQQKIEDEHQELASVEVQTDQLIQPLEVSQQEKHSVEEKVVYEDELAELAEMNESQVSDYYPPDDDLAIQASSSNQDKKNVS